MIFFGKWHYSRATLVDRRPSRPRHRRTWMTDELEADMTSPKDLKDAGLKATVPRLRIINLFESSRVRHLSAEDVYKQLLTEGLDIGLATVYRVLTQFE